VTSGPGGTNAITGVYGAYVDSIGMLVISGQVKWETTVRSTGLPLRQYGDQELDIEELVRPITKYCFMVTDPESIRYHLEKALYLATSGRPGPVWLDIPLNVQAAKINPETLKGFDPKELDEPWKKTNLTEAAKQTLEKIDGKKVTSYKALRKDIDINISKLENGEYKLEDIIQSGENNANSNKSPNNIILGKYDDKEVILKKGKFGLYVTCGELSKTLKQLGNRPIESIQLDEVIPLLEEGSNMVREVSANISIRKSKKGDYIFFKTPKMKKPKFFALKGFEEDYKTCDMDVLKSWFKDKHDIF
jgi:exonuclease VII small subunit